LKGSVAATAYAVSALASLLHVRAALTGAVVPDLFAMRLLTYTFVVLVLPLAVVTRGQPGARRAVWAAALAAFAVSALHLSQLHQGDASWPVELLGHHASVPLAFAILYQDYPFALADLFLKRALTLLMLVTTAFVAIATFGVRSTAFDEFVRVGARRPAGTAIIPAAERPRYGLVISELTGGRRLLSDGLSMLESIAIVVARRVDAIRITGERYQREVREQEMAKLATEAELRALRTQVNPHFLFNTLTTIGYLIQTAPPRALETLMQLTAL